MQPIRFRGCGVAWRLSVVFNRLMKRLTWQRVSCRSPRSSTWSWLSLVGHTLDPNTASETRPPPWLHPLLPARYGARAPCAAAWPCDDGASPPLWGRKQTSTQEGRCVSDIISDIISRPVKPAPTFFSVFFSRLLTCFTFTAFFLRWSS